MATAGLKECGADGWVKRYEEGVSRPLETGVQTTPSIMANGIQLEYDTFGDHRSPALLLIMGLGCQMILWDK